MKSKSKSKTKNDSATQILKVLEYMEKGRKITLAKARQMKIKSLTGVICHMRNININIRTYPANGNKVLKYELLDY